MIQTVRSWSADLVEQRRRLRVFIVSAAALYGGANAVLQIAMSGGEATAIANVANSAGLAGIVAAMRRTIASLHGVHMVEIVLDRSARGQALGLAVHQHFATAVAATAPDAVITGTIARENVPSWRTATRAGRIEIGAWYRLDLAT